MHWQPGVGVGEGALHAGERGRGGFRLWTDSMCEQRLAATSFHSHPVRLSPFHLLQTSQSRVQSISGLPFAHWPGRPPSSHPIRTSSKSATLSEAAAMADPAPPPAHRLGAPPIPEPTPRRRPLQWLRCKVPDGVGPGPEGGHICRTFGAGQTNGWVGKCVY